MKGYINSHMDELTLVDRPTPKAGPYDAIVHPLVVSISPSDIYMLFSYDKVATGEFILGHQAVGEVVEVGDLVSDFRPGDRVIIPAVTPDWNALQSQRGIPMHSNGLFGGWKFGRKKDGVFAELVHVNNADANLAHLPPEIPMNQAVLLCSTASIGMYGAETAKIRLGSRVAVAGMTPMGLVAIRGAVLQGAGQVCAIGFSNRAADLARMYGATDFVPFDGTFPVPKLMELTNGYGFDSVILAGTPIDALESALAITAPGGTISNCTLLIGEDNVSIPLGHLGYGLANHSFHGGLCPGGRYRMEQLIALVQNGRLDLAPLITHTFHGMESIPEAMDLFQREYVQMTKPIIWME